MPFNFGYGVPPAQGGFITLPPPDVIPQTRAGIARATMGSGPASDVSVAVRAVAEARSLGVDPVELADAIARRLEQALAPVYDGMRYASFQSLPLSIGTESSIAVNNPTTKRVYLFLINTHPTQDLFVAFDRPATILDTPIRAGDGFYEWLFVIPQNTIYLIANGGATSGVAVFGELDPRSANRDPAQTAPPRIDADYEAAALPPLALMRQSAQIIALPSIAGSYVEPLQSSVPTELISPSLPSATSLPVNPIYDPARGWIDANTGDPISASINETGTQS
jgi:hypothetical protein